MSASALEVFTCAPQQPWQRGNYSPPQCPKPAPKAISGLDEFTFANLNVLTSTTTIQTWATQSNVRYPYITDKLLPSMDMDVIGFNEVCPAFEKSLFASKPLQSISTSLTYVSASSCAKGPHYVGLLSRLPVIVAFQVPLAAWGRSAVVICVEKNGESFIVCSAHLTAQEENEKIRVQQLKGLMQAIKTPPCEVPAQYHECFAQKRVCIMGDFNYHLPTETQHIYRAGYIDCWRQVHDNEPAADGATWDGANTWWLPFDNRRMRLDRIVIPADCLYHPVACAVFAQNPIPNARAAVPFYSVMPSDHYGLSVCLRPRGGAPASTTTCTADRTRNNRTMRKIIIMRVVAISVLSVTLTALTTAFVQLARL